VINEHYLGKVQRLRLFIIPLELIDKTMANFKRIVAIFIAAAIFTGFGLSIYLSYHPICGAQWMIL